MLICLLQCSRYIYQDIRFTLATWGKQMAAVVEEVYRLFYFSWLPEMIAFLFLILILNLSFLRFSLLTWRETDSLHFEKMAERRHSISSCLSGASLTRNFVSFNFSSATSGSAHLIWSKLHAQSRMQLEIHNQFLFFFEIFFLSSSMSILFFPVILNFYIKKCLFGCSFVHWQFVGRGGNVSAWKGAANFKGHGGFLRQEYQPGSLRPEGNRYRRAG